MPLSRAQGWGLCGAATIVELVSPVVPRGRDLIVAALLLLSLGGAAPYFGRLMNANERPRIVQAIAWVDTGELAVDGPAARGIAPGIDVARSPIDERLYPNKPPGATVPAVVAYAGLRALASVGGPRPTLKSVTIAARVLGGLLPAAVLLLLLLRRLRARGVGPRAEAAVLILALATPWTSYSRLLFGHTLSGCLLIVGMWMVLDGTDPDRHSWRHALGGGALAAGAITVEYLAAFAGLPLAWLLVRRWRQGTPWWVSGAAMLGALLPVTVLGAYHAEVFGSPWATGYHHVLDRGFAEIHGRGLLGLGLPTGSSLFEHLISPWGGLLVWAPMVAVGLGVALWRWRELDLEERLASGTLLLFAAIVTGLAQTGGWRVGPRYLVLVMPLAAYGIVRLLDGAGRYTVLGAAVLGLSLASTLLNALAANLFPHLIPHGNPFADLLVPLAVEGRMSHCVVPGGGGALMLMVGVALGLVAWGVVRCLARSRAATVGLGVVIGAGLMIGLLGPDEHPDALGDLEAIRSIWEPEGTREDLDPPL